MVSSVGAVAVVGHGNTRRYVPVKPGISDETSELVQVTGALAAGQARISHRGRPALRLAT